MDKKNLVAFLALSLAVLIISNMLFPPPKPPQPKEGEKPVAEADAADADAKPGEPAKLAAAPGDAALAEDADDAAAEPADAQADPAAPTVPLEFVSLGSLDRDTGYRMLLTLTNQGAAVKRAELNSPRFLDLVDRSGYLGHLELADTADGVKVQVVGKGTPADAAGVRAGDLIVGIQRAKGKMVDVTTIEEYEAVRLKTRPEQELTLNIVRDGGTPQTMVVKLVRRPLEVMRPEIDNIEMRHGKVPEGFVDPPSFLTSMTTLGGLPLNARDAKRIGKWLEQGNWQVTSHDETSATFERPIPAQKLKVIKRYTLVPVPEGSRQDRDFPGYNLTLDVEVQNTGDAPQSVAYRLDGPTGLPLEGWWYTHKISQRWFSAAGLRDVVVRFAGQTEKQIDCATIAADKAEPMGQGASLAFVGVDAVYFSAVFIPVKASLEEDWLDSTEAIRIGPHVDVGVMPTRFTNVSCRMTRKPIELAVGESKKDSYVVFIGPKRPRSWPSTRRLTTPTIRSKTSSTTACGPLAPWPAACSASSISSTALSATSASRSSCSPYWCAAACSPSASSRLRTWPACSRSSPSSIASTKSIRATCRSGPPRCRMSTAKTKSTRSAVAFRSCCSCRSSSASIARSWSTSSSASRRCSAA